MRAIDELHLEYPFLGARQMRKIVKREGRPYAGRLRRKFAPSAERASIKNKSVPALSAGIDGKAEAFASNSIDVGGSVALSGASNCQVSK